MRKYPNADLIRLFALGNSELILVNSLRAFREVTFTHEFAFAKPTFLKRLVGEMVGDGLFFAEGEGHRQQRKLLAGPFLTSNVKSLLPIFEMKADGLCSALAAITGDSRRGIVEISSLISKTTFDIISLAILGLKPENDSLTSELAESYHTVFSSTPLSRIMLLLSSWIPIRKLLPIRTNRDYVYANGKIQHVLKSHVRRRIHEIRSAQQEDSPDRTNDLLTLMIKEQLKRRDECIEDEIVDHYMRLILRLGQETVGTALIWAFHALANHPDIQNRLRQEINTLCCERGGRLKYTEICSLDFLDCFVKEVLRCYPPSVCSMREAVKPVSICGQLIPAGTTVLMFPVVPQSNSTVWGPDPDKFDPDRWKALPSTARVGYAFQAFNTGPRTCLGKAFALLEIKVLIIKLVKAWNFCPVPKPVAVQKIGLLYKPANGLELRVQPAL
ncbi:hypothetical protein AJ79_08405 [Helicocarpus griseus UAMH5409]|uniref:Cytochrome P450 monooxygenase n=1 Tax=Helicocarpus griseus UAMH5409 TaxID=1447875 RepID=A0A2B7WKF5_9EURO|nr:hypothetical protein AJ79_08405 [Helicocarpus griseus UAMH5409]